MKKLIILLSIAVCLVACGKKDGVDPVKPVLKDSVGKIMIMNPAKEQHF